MLFNGVTDELLRAEVIELPAIQHPPNLRRLHQPMRIYQ